eukprot:c4425_g1_i1.p1 GENE.c4425_g1_i1~~c4425_g1_i1.p1  ORF type:complete len:415 (-),score=99.92 c4425_g1_i1:179-1423(-)
MLPNIFPDFVTFWDAHPEAQTTNKDEEGFFDTLKTRLGSLFGGEEQPQPQEQVIRRVQVKGSDNEPRAQQQPQHNPVHHRHHTQPATTNNYQRDPYKPTPQRPNYRYSEYDHLPKHRYEDSSSTDPEAERAMNESLVETTGLDVQIKKDEDSLREMLAQKGFLITNRSGQLRNGNCWAGALAFACQQSKITGLEKLNPTIVRQIAVDSLIRNMEWYLPFFSSSTENNNTSTDEKRELFSSESKEMLNSGRWQSSKSNIGDLLLDAFARALEISICRFNSDGTITLVGDPKGGPKGTIFVGYVATPNSEHYHGVEKLTSQDDIHREERDEKRNIVLETTKYPTQHAQLLSVGLDFPVAADKLLRKYNGQVEPVKDMLQKVEVLQQMGFTDEEKAVMELVDNNGDLERTIGNLCSV